MDPLLQLATVDPSPRPDTVCYLVRHCDVENPRGVIYGHLPGFGLSPKGREQGARLGEFFAKTGIAAIFTSPLQRARETADLIQGRLPHRVPEVVDVDLIEAEFGRYLQGVPYAQIPWRRPRWLVHMILPGLLPGDERLGSMKNRVQRVIDRGRRELEGAPFVCISHGDPIQAFWATSDHRPPWALHRLQCAKGGMLELRYRDSRLVSKRYLSPDAVAGLVLSPSQDLATSPGIGGAG